jgi:hypothetical protein
VGGRCGEAQRGGGERGGEHHVSSLRLLKYLATFLSQALYPQGSVPLPSTPMKPSLHRCSQGAPGVGCVGACGRGGSSAHTHERGGTLLRSGGEDLVERGARVHGGRDLGGVGLPVAAEVDRRSLALDELLLDLGGVVGERLGVGLGLGLGLRLGVGVGVGVGVGRRWRSAPWRGARRCRRAWRAPPTSSARCRRWSRGCRSAPPCARATCCCRGAQQSPLGWGWGWGWG